MAVVEKKTAEDFMRKSGELGSEEIERLAG